jgi:hypothetical protein
VFLLTRYYTGPRGRRIIRKCAKKVIRDYDDDDVVIIETDNPQCLQLWQQDANILEADMDYPVVGLGLRGGTDSPPRQALDEADVPYGMEMVQADQLEAGDRDVLVCIVDIGVAIGRREFDQANIQGTDTVKFYGPEWNWDAGKQGHAGTHVAGTIAVKAGNGIGVRGISSKLKLHIVRALDDNGQGYESDIQAAVEQCVNAGANVINLSLGGTRISSRSARFYDSYANDYGIMMVAAAGNDGNTGDFFPAAHPAVRCTKKVYSSSSRNGGMALAVQRIFCIS